MPKMFVTGVIKENDDVFSKHMLTGKKTLENRLKFEFSRNRCVIDNEHTHIHLRMRENTPKTQMLKLRMIA